MVSTMRLLACSRINGAQIRINVKRLISKTSTALLRVIVIFFGFPLIMHFYKNVLPDLLRSGSSIGGIVLFTSVLLPMILDSTID